jgi:membrane protein
VKTAYDLIRQTIKEWSEDKVPRLGAALAYYTMFSLAPLLIIAIAIAGFVFGEEAARGRVTAELGSLINDDAASMVEDLILNARRPAAGLVATVVGVVTLLVGASGVIGQLKDSMNTIWEVAPKPGRGIIGLVKDRFLSLAMVLGIGFLLLASLLLSAGLSAVSDYAFGEESTGMLQVLSFVVSFAVITLLFAVIYKVLPDVKIAWRDVWIGALVTAFLFNVGKFLIGQYLSRSTTASVFGAAGSLILILLWIYYSAQILFFGAEFTQVYANRYGTKLAPAEGAVALTTNQRVQEGIARKGTVAAALPEKVPAGTRAENGLGASLAIVALVVFDLFRRRRNR